jgi:hypothetical protein
MGICVVGMGDCGNKSDQKAITNITNINKSMTNMVSSTKQSSIIQSFNTQSNKVKITWPNYPGFKRMPGEYLIDGCTFDNIQTMNATQKVSISLDLSSTTNLQNQISSTLKADQAQATKQKTEFLATASNTSNNYTEINQVIDNLVSNNITNEVVQHLTQILKNFQGNELILEGPIICRDGKPYAKNKQEMLVTQISDTLTKAITGTTVANAISASATASQTQASDQEAAGATSFITGLLDSLFGGLSSVMTGPLIFLGIGLIAFVILAVVYKAVIAKKIDQMPMGPGGLLQAAAQSFGLRVTRTRR